MAVVYVRLTGNDSTGTGAYDNPYLTIAKAVSVASAFDTVDVGPGSFLETVLSTIAVPLFIRAVSGQTFWQCATLSGGDPAFMKLTSALSGVAGNVVVSGFVFQPMVAGFRTIALIQGVPANGAWWVRNIFRHTLNEFALYRQDTDDQTVVLLNNTLVSQIPGTTAGRGIADLNSPLFRASTIAVNNIFKDQRSVVDDTLGQRGIVSGWNCFYKNDRDFRFGTYGQGDLISTNPLFTNEALQNYSLATNSPCLAAGFDVENLQVPVTNDVELNPSAPFGDGLVRDALPTPNQTNLGSYGSKPDMGAIETATFDTKRQVNNYVIHTVLSAIANELDSINSLMEYVKLGRTTDGADVNQLQQRWGALLGVNRPNGFNRNDFEAFIQTLIDAYQVAPARGAIQATIAALMNTQVIRQDYFKVPRFRLGHDLKIVLLNPIGNPVDITVTAGRFQLLNQWFKFEQQTLTGVTQGVHLLYACPFDASLLQTDGTPKLLSNLVTTTDEVLPPDYNYFFSVNVRVTKGSNKVVRASGSPLYTVLQPGFVMQLASYDYHISSIIDQDNLLLSEPWQGDDQILGGFIGLPMKVFGYVTVVDGATLRVVSHSRLGFSAYLDSSQGKANTFKLQIASLENATFLSTARAESQLFSTICKMVPVHKRGLVGFQDEGFQANIANVFADKDNDFLNPFLDIFTDSTWDATF